jgi:hypothetical protein
MYTNMALDFGIGLVPVLGDIADAWFKCNTRNNIVLERYLRERGLKHPAPAPEPQQSGVRRWFGTGPKAPGSHPVLTQPETASPPVPVRTTSAHPNTPAATPPSLPARKGFNVFGAKGASTQDASGLERDLEAQNHGGGDIHYSRE